MGRKWNITFSFGEKEERWKWSDWSLIVFSVSIADVPSPARLSFACWFSWKWPEWRWWRPHGHDGGGCRCSLDGHVWIREQPGARASRDVVGQLQFDSGSACGRFHERPPLTAHLNHLKQVRREGPLQPAAAREPDKLFVWFTLSTFSTIYHLKSFTGLMRKIIIISSSYCKHMKWFFKSNFHNLTTRVCRDESHHVVVREQTINTVEDVPRDGFSVFFLSLLFEQPVFVLHVLVWWVYSDRLLFSLFL